MCLLMQFLSVSVRVCMIMIHISPGHTPRACTAPAAAQRIIPFLFLRLDSCEGLLIGLIRKPRDREARVDEVSGIRAGEEEDEQPDTPISSHRGPEQRILRGLRVDRGLPAGGMESGAPKPVGEEAGLLQPHQTSSIQSVPVLRARGSSASRTHVSGEHKSDSVSCKCSAESPFAFSRSMRDSSALSALCSRSHELSSCREWSVSQFYDILNPNPVHTAVSSVALACRNLRARLKVPARWNRENLCEESARSGAALSHRLVSIAHLLAAGAAHRRGRAAARAPLGKTHTKTHTQSNVFLGGGATTNLCADQNLT